jgi:hypothetical protein
LKRRSNGANLSDKEGNSLGNTANIVKMSRKNGQRASTHSIAGVANNLHLAGREVGDLAPVLQVLGIAVGHDADDLGLDALGQVLDGAVD